MCVQTRCQRGGSGGRGGREWLENSIFHSHRLSYANCVHLQIDRYATHVNEMQFNALHATFFQF